MMTQTEFLAAFRESYTRQCENHGVDPDLARGVCNNLAAWIALEIEEGQRELAELRAKLDAATTDAVGLHKPMPNEPRNGPTERSLRLEGAERVALLGLEVLHGAAAR